MNTQNSVSAYSSSFEIAVSFVLKAEGGYVNDPADPGGETHYGISQRSYPDLDIKGLTKIQACELYYQDYWQPCRCDEMPAAVACIVFDTAVNMGTSTAIRFLQRSVNAKPDGIIGSRTLAAVYQFPVTTVLPECLSRRANRYHAIARIKTKGRFIRGWMKRTYELQQHLYEERLL